MSAFEDANNAFNAIRVHLGYNPKPERYHPKKDPWQPKLSTLIFTIAASVADFDVYTPMCIHRKIHFNYISVRIVTRLHKSGAFNAFTDYRLISILPKNFYIIEFLFFNDIYPKRRHLKGLEPHVFKKSHSTQSQAVYFSRKKFFCRASRYLVFRREQQT